MKLFLSLILSLSLSFSFAQPGGYVEGTQVNWNYLGYDHSYFRAVGWNPATDIVIWWGSGNGETNFSTIENQGIPRQLKDAGINWDGTFTVPGIGVKKVLVLGMVHTGWDDIATLASHVNYFFNNHTAVTIDTSAHNRLWISGISGAVGRGIAYMANSGSHNSIYRNSFGVTLFSSSTFLDHAQIALIKATKHHLWYGTNEGNPPEANNYKDATIDTYNYIQGTKRIGFTTGGGHNSTTWDDFFSKNGTDSTTNRYIWAVQAPEPAPGTGGGTQSTTRFYPKIAGGTNGRKTFDIARLIDRDTLTKLSTTNTDETYSYPGEYYILFDNYVNGLNWDVWQMGGGGTWEVTVLTDDNDNHMWNADNSLDVGDSLTTFNLTIDGSYQVYKHNDLSGLTNVRGLRIIARTYADKNAQNYEFKFYGDSVAPAPAFYRTEVIKPISDPGKYVHGVGGLDNVNKTLFRKLGWSWRIGYFGPIFDREITSRSTPFSDPSYEFYLGRNGFDGFNTNVFNFARSWNIETRIYFAGGNTKNLTSTEAATYDYVTWSKANNYKYIEPGADSTQKINWAPEARRQKIFASLYGSNTSASLSGLNVTGAVLTTGQGGEKKQEPGNEYSRNFNNSSVPVNHGHYSPRVLYALMDTVYYAVKAVDSNLLVYLPALTYLDTIYIRDICFVHWLKYGTSKAVPWDGYGFNVYFNDFYDEQGGDTSNVAMVPGRWNVINRTSALNKFLDKLTPNRSRYDITEFSGGASNEIPASPFNVGFVSGKTDQQIMCDNTFRDKKHLQIGGKGHLGTAYYYQYGHDGSYPFDFMALTDWGGSSDTLRMIGKVWAQINTIETPYSGWADTLRYGDSTGSTVAVQTEVGGTKKLYSFWRETANNSSESLSINLGTGVIGVNLITYDYYSETPIVTPLPASNTVNVTSFEKGSYLEVTYASIVKPPSSTLYKRFNLNRQ